MPPRRQRVTVNRVYLARDFEFPEELEVVEMRASEAEVLCLPPNPANEDWIDFLYWLADHTPARDVVYVTEKPWKHTQEYAEYLCEGGVDR